jgi:hypothetical protein
MNNTIVEQIISETQKLIDCDCNLKVYINKNESELVIIDTIKNDSIILPFRGWIHNTAYFEPSVYKYFAQKKYSDKQINNLFHRLSKNLDLLNSEICCII